MNSLTDYKAQTKTKSKPIRVLGYQLDALIPVKNHFGYEDINTAMRNCVTVGLKIFQEDPEKFRRILAEK